MIFILPYGAYTSEVQTNIYLVVLDFVTQHELVNSHMIREAVYHETIDHLHLSNASLTSISFYIHYDSIVVLLNTFKEEK